jgi:1-hydroxycarotenoid 3,4-desaturase
MFDVQPSSRGRSPAIVVGAGVGGLSAALRLQSAGYQVTLVERHAWVGGKMRGVPSDAGPVDAGPTVMTMRRVFDDLFQVSGSPLSDNVTLIREPRLARHFWPDGTSLDLFDDPEANAAAVERFSGAQSRREFEAFDAEARALYALFDAPMMRAAEPKMRDLASAALSAPRHLAALLPTATLAKALRRRFSDPRLAQLFGRYATYVGGAPDRAPALLSLIWQAEASGVWRVQGGMHRLAEAVAQRLLALGGTVLLQTDVRQIDITCGQVAGVTLENNRKLAAELVVFNGDPRALATGKLGRAAAQVAPQTRKAARSLSARVWSFAARPENAPEGGPELGHHNVFFGADPLSEFKDLHAGRMPRDPTIYICAEDRGDGAPPPGALERFEMILNAAPLTDAPLNAKTQNDDEATLCRQVTFQTLARFGLRFSPVPEDSALMTPAGFEAMFPGSAGSLYGQSPHGMTASLARPRARTVIQGLYLAGGGTHPGAGVPMAAFSGQHAAAAIMQDRVST